MQIPFVQDYWIGTTYLHHQTELWSAPRFCPPDVKLRAVVMDDIAEIIRSPDPELQRRRAVPGESVTRYGAWLDDRLVGVCTFAFGEDYRGYYTLRPSDAELADIFTVGACRGRGIAAALIRYGTEAMHASGFLLLYAKIWRNNQPSLHAFAKAGWRKHCFFIRVQPTVTPHPLSVQWPPFANPVER